MALTGVSLACSVEDAVGNACEGRPNAGAM
jgi:hypothetical protein